MHGHYWHIPNVRRTGEFPHVLVDVNYWKTFVHSELLTTAGDRGCISIFGKDVREQEHQQKWPGGHIKQVGRRTTEDAAHEWEEKQEKS